MPIKSGERLDRTHYNTLAGWDHIALNEAIRRSPSRRKRKRWWRVQGRVQAPSRLYLYARVLNEIYPKNPRLPDQNLQLSKLEIRCIGLAQTVVNVRALYLLSMSLDNVVSIGTTRVGTVPI